MKRDWKYMLYLSLAFGLFLVVKLMEPRRYDCTGPDAVGCVGYLRLQYEKLRV